MKIIVSRLRADGTYPEVGMNDRALFSIPSVKSAKKRAADFAQGRPHRIEYFTDDHLYTDPFKVEHC